MEGGYQLGSGGALPPLVVVDEAIAMVVALGAAANIAAGSLGDATLSALSKVVQVLPPRLRRRAEALRAVTVTSPLGQAPRSKASVLAASPRRSATPSECLRLHRARRRGCR